MVYSLVSPTGSLKCRLTRGTLNRNCTQSKALYSTCHLRPTPATGLAMATASTTVGVTTATASTSAGVTTATTSTRSGVTVVSRRLGALQVDAHFYVNTLGSGKRRSKEKRRGERGERRGKKRGRHVWRGEGCVGQVWGAQMGYISKRLYDTLLDKLHIINMVIQHTHTQDVMSQRSEPKVMTSDPGDQAAPL